MIFDFVKIKLSNVSKTINLRKKPLYAGLPNFYHVSVKSKNQISKILPVYFTYLRRQLVLLNNSKIISCFNLKD